MSISGLVVVGMRLKGTTLLLVDILELPALRQALIIDLVREAYIDVSAHFITVLYFTDIFSRHFADCSVK